MKLRPSVLITMALSATLLASSCVKTYTCQCVIKYSGAPGLPDSTTNEFEIRDTKSSAKSKCTAGSDSYQSTVTNTTGQISTSENCTLY